MCIYNILMSMFSVYTTKIPVSAWKVLAILGSIATMTMYVETMLIPTIPDLIKHFHVSYSISSWLLTAYLITAAVMTPIVGKLSDTYSKKKSPAHSNDNLCNRCIFGRIFYKHILFANYQSNTRIWYVRLWNSF